MIYLLSILVFWQTIELYLLSVLVFVVLLVGLSMLLTVAERVLIGSAPSAALVAQAAKLAARDAQPRSSLLRGTATYRTAMVEVLVRRALTTSLDLNG